MFLNWLFLLYSRKNWFACRENLNYILFIPLVTEHMFFSLSVLSGIFIELYYGLPRVSSARQLILNDVIKYYPKILPIYCVAEVLKLVRDLSPRTGSRGTTEEHKEWYSRKAIHLRLNSHLISFFYKIQLKKRRVLRQHVQYFRANNV